MKKIIYIVLMAFLSLSSLSSLAQSSRPLPLLEINPDVRTSAMGDAYMGESKGMYIYTNPTSMLFRETTFYTDYTYLHYPTIEDSRQRFHAASLGFRYRNHGLMAGFRYWGGLASERVGEDMIERKTIRPLDWTIDLTYAVMINDYFSAYVGGNFIQSYNSKVSHGFSGSVGAYYRNQFSFNNGNETNYTIGLAVQNIGQKVKYGTVSYNLPSSVALGGSMDFELAEEHHMEVGLTSRYFILPSNAKSFTGGVGLEYSAFDIASLRCGYHWGDNSGYFTVGGGAQYKFIHLDAAYIIAKAKEFNILKVGVGFNF